MSFPTPLAGGAQDILTLTAAVPASASSAYRTKQVLDLTDVSINEGALAAVGDDAVHVVAYFGDTTGNGSYSSLDGQRVLRHAVGLDSGFAAYPLADPVLIADITGNSAVSSLDATRILQEVVGIDRPEIPPLAGIVITAPGPDPYVHIPTDLSGTPGSLLTVPVLIDDAVGLEVRRPAPRLRPRAARNRRRARRLGDHRRDDHHQPDAGHQRQRHAGRRPGTHQPTSRPAAAACSRSTCASSRPPLRVPPP
jgi:hypothetical protein